MPCKLKPQNLLTCLRKVYYFPHILTSDLGQSHATALQLAAGLAATYWVFSLIPWFWLDRISRRMPLIGGAIVCSFCFLIVRVLAIFPFRLHHFCLHYSLCRPPSSKAALPTGVSRRHWPFSSSSKRSSRLDGSQFPGSIQRRSCLYATVLRALQSPLPQIGFLTT